MALLELRSVTKQFGGLMAVRDVSFTVEPGMVLSIIGPNGAGKTTLFNLITGVHKPTKGDIVWNGKSIAGLRSYQIARLGIGRTFQIVKPFPNLTILENVMAGAFARTNSLAEARKEALEILEFTGLLSRKDQLAKNLTLGGRKRLEVARSLATKPQIILLDEVVAGLNPTETEETIELIKSLKSRGVSAVAGVEHVMRVVMSLSDRIVVIHHGEKIAEGTPEVISRDRRVIEAYLGEDYAQGAGPQEAGVSHG